MRSLRIILIMLATYLCGENAAGAEVASPVPSPSPAIQPPAPPLIQGSDLVKAGVYEVHSTTARLSALCNFPEEVQTCTFSYVEAVEPNAPANQPPQVPNWRHAPGTKGTASNGSYYTAWVSDLKPGTRYVFRATAQVSGMARYESTEFGFATPPTDELPPRDTAWQSLMNQQIEKMNNWNRRLDQLEGDPNTSTEDESWQIESQHWGEFFTDNTFIEQKVLVDGPPMGSETRTAYVAFRTIWLRTQKRWNDLTNRMSMRATRRKQTAGK